MIMASTKGSVTAELSFLIKRMIAFGESKRSLKLQAINDGKQFFNYYTARIFSFSTLETYSPKIKTFAHWCVDKYGIEHITQIKHSMFREYIIEQMPRWKPNTTRTHLAAIVKLGEGLGKKESFHRVSRQIQSQLPLEKVSRPKYQNISQALSVLAEVERSNALHGLTMRVQIETACRLCEVERLRPESLGGLTIADGSTAGVLHLRGKGDRPRDVLVSEQTYRALELAFTERRRLIDYDEYRAAVYRASEKLGLHSGGTHKARRTSIQSFFGAAYRELRSLGLSSWEASDNALHEANRQLGHSSGRRSTTRIYINA
jgi:integrase